MPKLTQQVMKKAFSKQFAKFGISEITVGGKTIKTVKFPTLKQCKVDGILNKIFIRVGDKVRVTIEENGVQGKVSETHVIRQIMNGDCFDPKGAYHIICEGGSFFMTSNRTLGKAGWFRRFEILERAN